LHTDPATSQALNFASLPLSQRLSVVEVGTDVFEGQAPEAYTKRVYGGHTIAQALTAADATVEEGRHIVSLQAYFLTAGDPHRPLRYTVARLRDGRSFSSRAVDVTQDGRLITAWRGLFQDETDISDIEQAPPPEVPDPESLPPLHVRRESEGHVPDGINWPPGHEWWKASRPFDIRYIDFPKGREANRCFWFRSRPISSRRQNDHRTILAFASDRSLVAAISHARGELTRGIVTKGSSLDHSMWFHTDVTAGEWLLYVQSSPYSTQRAGIAQGHIYNRGGLMVASVIQQGIRSKPQS
jgi:acyl-CoA thioesterase II